MPHPDINAYSGHPDEGLLHEWLDDQLSPTDAAAIQAHIAGCAECGARVAEARGLISASRRILSALDEVPAGVIPTNFDAANSAESSVACTDADGVVSINKGRAAARVDSPKRAYHWRRAASIAAVLLVAVTLARSGFRKDAVLKSEHFQVPGTISESVAPPAAIATREAAAPAKGADRVADTRAVAPAGEAPRIAELRESAAFLADASARRTNAATTFKPEQVASAQSGARTSASTSAKQLSEIVVADAAAVTAAPAKNVAPAAVGSVSNAPPVGAAMAGAPVVNSPLATPPASAPRDLAKLKPELEVSQRRSTQFQRTDERADSTAARPTLQLRGFGNTFGTVAAAGSGTVPAFDSVTLVRTNCAPVCEPTLLHLNALGVVRYQVGTGNTQRVVMGQLSTSARNELTALLVRELPDAFLRVGNTECSVRGRSAEAAPAVQLWISYPGATQPRAEARCMKSAAEVTRMGAVIDSIAGADALMRRVPPRE